MTANAMRSDVDNCFSAGMNDFISKPIDPKLMWSSILRWLPKVEALPLNEASNDDTEPLPKPTTVTSSVAVTALPKSIPGLDMADGLRRMNGNEKFFRSILLKYAEGQTDALTQVRAYATRCL
jgi:two-component system sensor histidine kinase/response regulator